MATAQEAQLAELLAGLDPADDGLRALLDDLARQHGLDGGRAGLADPDDVPELPAEPYVHRGDLYALGDHRLLCGDSTGAADVARLTASAAIRPWTSWRTTCHDHGGTAPRQGGGQ